MLELFKIKASLRTFFFLILNSNLPERHLNGTL